MAKYNQFTSLSLTFFESVTRCRSYNFYMFIGALHVYVCQ